MNFVLDLFVTFFHLIFRTSVYQSSKTSLDTFKMPQFSLVSPPGVKTRARRSSIYQRKPGRLVSPLKAKTSRTSMYVSVKAKEDKFDVFSKVWTTPIVKPDPIQELSPKKTPGRKAAQSPKKAVSKSPSKAIARKSVSPKKIPKTPRSTRKASQEKAKEPETSTPAAAKKTPRAPKSAKCTPAQGTPVKANSTPVGKTSKTNVITSTPSKSLKEITGKSFYGTPGETPIQNERIDDVFVFSALPPSSAKTSARKITLATPQTGKRILKSAKKTTPKSVAKTPAGKRKRRLTDIDVSLQTMSTPNKSVAKTPAGKRKRCSTGKDESLQSSKRTKAVKSASPKKRVIKSVKRKVVKEPKVIGTNSENVVKMSSVEMTSTLESVKKSSVKKSAKRKASISPSKRQVKLSKLAEEAQTPRVMKVAKRTSPKKLAEIVEANTNNSMDNLGAAGDSSLLNDTFNTDSRSSRCVIL